jgi:mono/diheme cytochrome c family protein
MMAALMMNQQTWAQDAGIGKWLVESRLDAVSKLIRNIAEDDVVKRDIVKGMRGNAMPAFMNLQKFIAQIAKEKQSV